MTGPTKANARRAPGGSQTTKQQRKSKPTGGRPEFQGKLNARNKMQRQPVWPNPRGHSAAMDLEAALARWPR